MRCANSQCEIESDYLRSGSLYAIDEHSVNARGRRSRFIWLCSHCTPRFVVETWRPPGQQLRPGRSAVLATAAAQRALVPTISLSVRG